MWNGKSEIIILKYLLDFTKGVESSDKLACNAKHLKKNKNKQVEETDFIAMVF